MSNHFHVLVRVPKQENISDEELLRRYRVLHPQATPHVLARLVVMEAAFKSGGDVAEAERQKLLRRMGNLSAFMKLFKQRFSIWYNKNHARQGTLWSERFTSVIVEGNHHFASLAVASYIDLNPVRAGLTQDPKDYRWCGYAEAVSTGGAIVQGLRRALGVVGENRSDAEMLAAYRVALFSKGAAMKRGDSKAARLSAEAAQAVAESGGALPLPERLWEQFRWLTKGAVIGSKEFVEAHLQQYREKTGNRLRSGIRPSSERDSEGLSDLYSLRGIVTE
jgi:REP element-mobilizing transposase RayT